jgi:type II secretory pathway pseudopilin PulG
VSGRTRQLASQEGISLIEVIVGAFVSIVVAAAVATGLVQNNDSALATQRQTELLSVLQARVEWVHQMLTENYSSVGFSAVALSSNPEKGKGYPPATSPTNPNDFITHWESGYTTVIGKNDSEGFLIEKNYSNTGQGLVSGQTSDGEQLMVEPANGKIPAENFVDITTGTAYPTKEKLPAGDPYAIVNTYVTLVPEDASQVAGGCNTPSGTGSTAGDARRIIVVARYEPPSPQYNADSKPQYATTLLTNPTPSNQCQTATGLTGIGGLLE